MCRQVECAKCHKPTYAGCGMHVEQVLGDVPRGERCACREGREGRDKPKGEKDAVGASSLFRRIFGG